MPSANQVIISAAGSGKTTLLVKEALSKPEQRIAIVTYTLNNVDEIRKKFFELNGFIPANISIFSWFAFLLRDCVRPYQNFVYSTKRIESICFLNGRSAKYVGKDNIAAYFFNNGDRVYTDKISEFACRCEEQSKGLVTKRLAEVYDEMYIDEVQDLAGHDLEFIELLLSSSMYILLVGDNRQATFATNGSAKNSRYRGMNIIDLFKKWEHKGLCALVHLTDSHRCNQIICDFADNLYPDMPRTTSKNKKETGHDGLFLVARYQVDEYMVNFQPQVLRYDRSTDCCGYAGINFGDSKGLTFDRVLIFPHGSIQKYLASGHSDTIAGSRAKFYVAVTRARYSVAFVYEDRCSIKGIQQYSSSEDDPISHIQPEFEQISFLL